MRGEIDSVVQGMIDSAIEDIDFCQQVHDVLDSELADALDSSSEFSDLKSELEEIKSKIEAVTCDSECTPVSALEARIVKLEAALEPLHLLKRFLDAIKGVTCEVSIDK